MMKKLMGLMVATLFATTAIATSVSAETASHDQTCGSDGAGYAICLANESWTAGFRAFDLLLHEPFSTSFPLWLGATSILVNPFFEPIPDEHGRNEVVRSRFNSDGTINDNNYANMTVGNCDPRINATTGNQSQTIHYTVWSSWLFPLDALYLADQGDMDYGFDGFWFTEFIYPLEFSLSQFHFTTSFAAGTFPCTVQIGDGNNTGTTNLTPASAIDHTVYTWP